MDGHELTHGEYLLDSVGVGLDYQPYIVQTSHEKVNSYYDFLTIESMKDVAALGKWVMRREAHCNLFYSAVLLRQWYRKLSRTLDGKDNNSDGNESIATKNDEGKNAVFEVVGDPLHYTQEAENMMSSSFSYKAHQVSVCDNIVHFWRKEQSYGDVLPLVNYEGNGKIQTSHPSGTKKMDGISRLSGIENVYATVTGRNV